MTVESPANPRPAPRHEGAFQNAPLPKPPSFNELDVSDKPHFVRNRPLLDASDVSTVQERHRDRLASLLAVDDLVAMLIRELRASGQLDETVFVFTSDNGYLSGEHRLRKKTQLYEAASRVPLIVRGPGFPRGARAEQIVANVDLAPTILELAGAEPGRVLDGRSLVPVAQDPSFGSDRSILLENQRSLAVRTPGFTYLKHASGRVELYDMRRDPFQLESRDDVPRYADVQAELDARLEELRDCAGGSCL